MEPEKKIDVEKLKHLEDLVKKGREFGLIYKFDAIGILMAQIKTLKNAGSNGKAKGFRMAADLLSTMKPVDGVAFVTRCRNCLSYDKQNGRCLMYGAAFPADGFCSRAQPENDKAETK